MNFRPLKKMTLIIGCLACLNWALPVQGAFIVEPRDGGKAFANFGFGGDTTSASNSTADGLAAGLTPGIGSVFGGNGSAADNYTYVYTPGVDVDNTVFSSGQDLGNGNSATGITGGASGLYNVYATWPETDNVTSLTEYSISGDSLNAMLTVDQNQAATGLGDGWVLIGTVDLTAGTQYVLSQQSGPPTFVSMRSTGVLFEAVPEPTGAFMMILASLFGLRIMRRR